MPVPAAYTSQRCSDCGHTEAGNRPKQAVFRCPGCKHEDNADMNAAENIRRQGLETLAKAGNSPRHTAGKIPGHKRNTPARRRRHAARLNSLSSRSSEISSYHNQHHGGKPWPPKES